MKTSVALLQMDCSGERPRNLARAEDMIREAAGKGGQVILLPEIFHELFFIMALDMSVFDKAEPIPGPITERMQELAAELGTAIVAPVYESVGKSVYYNSAAVIDADGSLLGVYRKNHIPLSTKFYEKLYFKPGNLGYPVFETRFGRIGILICHDRHYPEGARALGLNGAEILLVPSATPTASLSVRVWEKELAAHAIFNEYFVASQPRRHGGRIPITGAAWSSIPPARSWSRPAKERKCSSPSATSASSWNDAAPGSSTATAGPTLTAS